MNYFNTLSVFSLVFATLYFTTGSKAATFDITNKCPYTVWAAAKPGGGKKLDTGGMWQISAPDGTTEARIWGRTNCQFDASGKGKCETGDCNGLLECQGYGAAPNTLAEYALKQYANLDYIDISVIDGFNVPMEFGSASGSCSRVMRCVGDIIGQCPAQLKVPGGCQGACPKLNQEQYCCNSGGPCNPTDLSKFFKDRCPDAYSYPKDDPTSLFTCPSGTNYKVIFCP